MKETITHIWDRFKKTKKYKVSLARDIQSEFIKYISKNYKIYRNSRKNKINLKTYIMHKEPNEGRDPNQKPKLCATIFDNHSVIMKKDSFEHLLNCLANQKFNPDEDAQAYIDDFWNQGIQLLNPKSQNPF